MFKLSVNGVCNNQLNSPFTITPVTRPIDLALALAESRGMNQSDLARSLNVSPQTVHNWTKRGMPPEHLPRVAGVLGVSIDFLVGRQVPQFLSGTPPSSALEPPLVYAGNAQNSRRMSVVGQAQIGPDGGFEETVLMQSGTDFGSVDVFGAHEDAFAIRVLGDQLYPALRHGMCLVVEPSGRAVAGEQVILHLRSGRILIRELLTERPDAVTVLAVNNPTSRETYLSDQIYKMMPVVALIPASKWRAP